MSVYQFNLILTLCRVSIDPRGKGLSPTRLHTSDASCKMQSPSYLPFYLADYKFRDSHDPLLRFDNSLELRKVLYL